MIAWPWALSPASQTRGDGLGGSSTDVLRLSILSAVSSRIEHMIEDKGMAAEVPAGVAARPGGCPMPRCSPAGCTRWGPSVAGVAWTASRTAPTAPTHRRHRQHDDRWLGCLGCGAGRAARGPGAVEGRRLGRAGAGSRSPWTPPSAPPTGAAGLPERRVGAGIAAQVGLARRDSPVKGARHLGLARALVGELPHTLAALSGGETSEWRATLIARETACLTRADRTRVDAELAARPGGIGALGDREAAAEARRIGYRLDPHALTGRAARRAQRTAGHPATRPGHHGLPVRAAARGPGRRGLRRPHQARRHPALAPGTGAAAARSWPTPSSNASPDRPPPPRSRSRSTS